MPACGGVFVTAKIYILAYDISKLAYNISLPLDTHNRPVACLGSRKGKAKGGGWKSLVTHAQKIRRKKKKTLSQRGHGLPLLNTPLPMTHTIHGDPPLTATCGIGRR